MPDTHTPQHTHPPHTTSTPHNSPLHFSTILSYIHHGGLNDCLQEVPTISCQLLTSLPSDGEHSGPVLLIAF